MNWRSGLRAVALSAIISAAVGAAVAHAESALEMASYCKPIAEAKHHSDNTISYTPTLEAGKCWGFFSAIQQGTGLIWTGEKKPTLGICPPPESTLTQLVMVFRKYVQEHPAKAHKLAFFVARDALADAFPCKD